MARWNPATGRMEDDDGNPVGTVDIGQMQPPAAPPPVVTPPPAPVSSRPISVVDGQVTEAPRSLMGQPPLTPLPTAPTGPIDVPATTTTPEAIGGMFKNTSRTTTTREVPTKREGALLGAESASIDRQASDARKEGALLGQKADAEKTGAEAESASRLGTANQVDKTLVEGGAAVDAAAKQVQVDRGKYSAEVDRKSKMDISGFYEGDKGRGRMLGNAIAVALGEIGKIFLRSNGPNAALASIKDIEDNYYEAQRTRIAQQDKAVSNAKDQVGMSQQALMEARQSKQDKYNDAALSSAARVEAIQAKTKAEAARIGTEHALVEGDRIAAGLETLKTQRLREYEQGIRTKVATESTSVAGTGVGGKGGQPTESQAKGALLAQQLKGELDTIRQNPGLAASVLDKMQNAGDAAETASKVAGSGLAGWAATAAGRWTGMIPKSKYDGMTDQEKVVANAWDNAIEKYARVLTGAGMPEGEARRLAIQDAPHAGDSPVVMAQKFKRLESFADQQMSVSGPAAAMIAPAAPGVKVAGAAPAASADDQAAIEWAKAHQGDPRAKRILQLHGM